MKRLIFTMMAMTVPVAAFAQADTRQVAEGVIVAPAVSVAASAATAVQAGGSTSGPRRRPSMVGYVENADIGTKFRVRFDAGRGLQGTDRAEFFYAKCGCYRFLPTSNAAYDPNASGPGPGVLLDANYTEFTVYGEYALNGRFSVLGNLPVRSLKPQTFLPGTGSFGDTSGVGDVRAGVKLSLASDSTSQITLQVLADMPSGDAGKGLGTDHWSIDPALLYNTQLGEHANLEAQFGTVLPTDGSAGVPTGSPDKFSGKVIYYGVGPSVDVYSNGRTRLAPVVELFGWHVVDGYSTFDGAPANGTNILNLKIGGRFAVGANSVYVGYGKALTDAKWYDDIVRLEYRYGF